MGKKCNEIKDLETSKILSDVQGRGMMEFGRKERKTVWSLEDKYGDFLLVIGKGNNTQKKKI